MFINNDSWIFSHKPCNIYLNILFWNAIDVWKFLIHSRKLNFRFTSVWRIHIFDHSHTIIHNDRYVYPITKIFIINSTALDIFGKISHSTDFNRQSKFRYRPNITHIIVQSSASWFSAKDWETKNGKWNKINTRWYAVKKWKSP